MAEIPVGILPDFNVQWDYTKSTQHLTEVQRFFNGRQQRRPMFQASGFQHWSATTTNLTLAQRQTLKAFLNAHRGSFIPFYANSPDPEYFIDYPATSIVGVNNFLIPFIVANAIDVVTVKVGGVSKAFTVDLAAGHANGDTHILLTGGVATGAVLVTLTARERLICISSKDNIAEGFQQTSGVVVTVSLEVEQVA